MTNIQALLALGAFLLLTQIIINTNKNSLYTEDVLYDSNFGITATSIASSIIEDATKLKFDNITDTLALESKDINLLTDPGYLGTEAGENPNDPKDFNDFDDFDGYTAVDSSMPSAIFNLNCKVNYINSASPDNPVNSRSFHKKLTIWVTSTSMRDTIVQSTVFSYWFFK